MAVQVLRRQDPGAVRELLGSVPMNELHRIDWNGPTLILVKPL